MIESTTDEGTWTPDTMSGVPPSSPLATAFVAKSAEGDLERRDESVEVALGDFAHDRDAEDGSIELPLSCVDDEPVLLEVCVKRLVGLSGGQTERRQRCSVHSC